MNKYVNKCTSKCNSLLKVSYRDIIPKEKIKFLLYTQNHRISFTMHLAVIYILFPSWYSISYFSKWQVYSNLLRLLGSLIFWLDYFDQFEQTFLHLGF